MIRRLPLILGVAGIIAGCAPGPSGTTGTSGSTGSTPIPRTTAPSTEQLVVLAGTVGAMTVVTPNAAGQLAVQAGGSATGLPASVVWLSSDGSQLLATTLDGRAALGSPDSPGSPIDWRAPPGDLSGPHPLRAFGSLGRNGQVAFVEGDPGAGTPGRLVVETLEGSAVRTVPLPTAPESPPTSLPDGRIAVIVRNDDDQPETLLVDADGRTQWLNGPPPRSIAIGGDIVATVDEVGALRVAPVSAWLAGSALPSVAAGDPGETAIQAQPSPSGTQLAVVVANVEGDADAIRILAATGGWHEIARFELPTGANRAVVGWLAVP